MASLSAFLTGAGQRPLETYIIGMTVPATPSLDLTLARWAKRTLTYGAMVTAVLSAGLFFLFQTANKAALAPYGLDPAGFSGSIAETIGGGLASLLVLAVIVLLAYLVIGWFFVLLFRSIGWLYRKIFGVPKWLANLEAWIMSDPTKRTERALGVGATFIVPLTCLCLLYLGTLIGTWRVSQAEWLVAANNCATGCFSYKQDGRPAPVVGRPIAANSSRMAIVVGSSRAVAIDVSKITSSEAYHGTPISVPPNAPWELKAQWWALRMLNADW